MRNPRYNLHAVLMLSLALLGSAVGCAHIPPGELAAIQPVSDAQRPRVGNAYLFRGFIGVFSTGMNSLGDELNKEGVRTHVYQADQWSSVADSIEKAYRNKGTTAEPIVLVGHSYGADNIVRIAQKLKDKNVEIDMLITLDPVTPPKVPANVKQVVNLYQSNGAMDAMPWLRGIPLEEEKPGAVKLANLDLRKDRTDLLDDDVNHFNIEKKEKVHAEVIKQIKQICLTRSEWAARRTSPTSPMQTAAVRQISNATPATQPVAQHALAK